MLKETNKALVLPFEYWKEHKTYPPSIING